LALKRLCGAGSGLPPTHDAGLVAFERQDVVAPAFDDDLRGLALGVQRVGGDDGAGEVHLRVFQ